MKTTDKITDELFINQTYDIGYWARHLKVTATNIAEAITNTGSNQVSKIVRYLRSRRLI